MKVKALTLFNCPILGAGVFVLAFTIRAVAAGDVLIVAPHPDDEVIGCAGLILRAAGEKRQTTVVVLTNGDGYVALAAAAVKKEHEQLTPEDFLKAGALRQGRSVSALKRLGVPRDDKTTTCDGDTCSMHFK